MMFDKGTIAVNFQIIWRFDKSACLTEVPFELFSSIFFLIGSWNLVLKHSVLHSPPNSRNTFSAVETRGGKAPRFVSKSEWRNENIKYFLKRESNLEP